jgi:nicotinamidase-related amidase
MTTALIIIDMQVASFSPMSARHDPAGLIERLNRMAAEIRARNGVVVFVQHDGPPGDPHQPETQGWNILPELDLKDDDIVVRKRSCDSFLNTDLAEILARRAVDDLVITGCATDYCVDTTVRSALGRGYKTTVPSDGHTTGTGREHLSAEQIIAHHNAIWADFISPAGAARVVPCATVFA